MPARSTLTAADIALRWLAGPRTHEREQKARALAQASKVPWAHVRDLAPDPARFIVPQPEPMNTIAPWEPPIEPEPVAVPAKRKKAPYKRRKVAA